MLLTGTPLGDLSSFPHYFLLSFDIRIYGKGVLLFGLEVVSYIFMGTSRCFDLVIHNWLINYLKGFSQILSVIYNMVGRNYNIWTFLFKNKTYDIMPCCSESICDFSIESYMTFTKCGVKIKNLESFCRNRKSKEEK